MQLVRNSYQSRTVDKNTGFTLIEVLIAMLVLAGGLLGLAGLQATSLSNGQSAYNRSQATQLAYQLADNMRANIPGVAAYTGPAAQIANCLTTSGASRHKWRKTTFTNGILPLPQHCLAVWAP